MEQLEWLTSTGELLNTWNSYQRSPKQCKDNLKNLRQFYKELKDGHERSAFNRDKWCSNFSFDIVTFRRHQHDCMNLSVLCVTSLFDLI